MQHGLALEQAFSIVFVHTMLSSFVEEMDLFFLISSLPDFQFYCTTEKHGMEFAAFSVICL